MRTIKFRGQRVDTKEWVYGYYFITPLTIENFGIGHLGDSIKRHCISNDDGVVFEVIPETVGQFVGLPDKNGKEIYDGDIVVSFAKVFKTVVEFNLYNCGFSPFSDIHTSFFADEVEVVGNIHEGEK